MNSSIFIIYSADTHLSYDSYRVEAIAESKAMAIQLLLPLLEKEAAHSYKDANYTTSEKMVSDLLNNLKDLNQTQTLDINYVLKEQKLNLLSSL